MLIRMWKNWNFYRVATIENSTVFPQKKLKIELLYDSTIPIYGYLYIGTEIRILKRYLPSHVHCSILQNSQDMNAT